MLNGPGKIEQPKTRRRIPPMKTTDPALSPSDPGDNSKAAKRVCTSILEAPSSSGCSASHGSISIIGRMRVMEDALTVLPVSDAHPFTAYDFFAVYDGHGGSRVSSACKERLHHLLAEEIEGSESSFSGGIDWEKVMVACFAKMDIEVGGGGGGGGEMEGGEVAMGSTAVVVMVGKEEIVVANCGDSRAVLCRGGATILPSYDHKPDRPDEERMEDAGETLKNWDISQVLGSVTTSRSLGYHHLKPFVIPVPEVTKYERTDSDEFIVIASDGLWGVVSNEVTCGVVKQCLDPRIRHTWSEGLPCTCAASLLAELAMTRGSRDNISVIVVEL